MFDFIKVWFYNMGAGPCEDAFCTNPFGLLKDWLYVSQGKSPLATMFSDGNIIDLVFNAMSGVAGMLLMLYFVLFMYEEFTRQGEATLQMFSKVLMKFGLGALILINGLPLVKGFCSIGDPVMNLIEGAFSGTNNSTTEFITDICKEYGYIPVQRGDKLEIPRAVDEGDDFGLPTDEAVTLFKETDTGTYLSNALFLVVINMVTIVITVIAITTAITRAIQIIVYASLSPLAIADVFGDGMHSRGIRFLKKLFAVSAQGPIVFFICQLEPFFAGYILKSDGAAGVIGNLGAWLAVMFGILAALKKAEKFATDLIL